MRHEVVVSFVIETEDNVNPEDICMEFPPDSTIDVVMFDDRNKVIGKVVSHSTVHGEVLDEFR